jgi:hypothetical protein
MGYEKILTETTSQEKLKMRHWVNPIVNNGRMKGLHVINCIDAGNAAFKYLVGYLSIKVKEIITWKR